MDEVPAEDLTNFESFKKKVLQNIDTPNKAYNPGLNPDPVTGLNAEALKNLEAMVATSGAFVEDWIDGIVAEPNIRLLVGRDGEVIPMVLGDRLMDEETGLSFQGTISPMAPIKLQYLDKAAAKRHYGKRCITKIRDRTSWN